jgi:hypothetical protein
LLALAPIVGIVAWASDVITMQGERTIYTVKCDGGSWTGVRCSGKLVAGDRYRFRALKAHGEVFFWILGSTEPSGRFTGCDVEDGRNWSCRAKATSAEAARSVTLEMVHGQPVRDPAGGPTRPFHSVSKFTWVLIGRGLWFGDTAQEL